LLAYEGACGGRGLGVGQAGRCVQENWFVVGGGVDFVDGSGVGDTLRC